ncbi:MAG: hypothetical protein ABSF98_25715 [Bryobacteraceae bacterium]|jgi:hypothetical protein
MGRKPQRHGWPEAKKLCRLNQNDIAMAKSLGFGPDALVRAKPDPQQKWKLPVKYWIHELHLEQFGFVVGEKPLPALQPAKLGFDEEAVRPYAEQLYREDSWERDKDEPARKKYGKSAPPGASDAAHEPSLVDGITDDDVPF